MIPNAPKVNQKNLRLLCWQRGFHGVTALARHIGKHRTSVHRAARTPEKFSETYHLIQKALQ